MKRNIAPYQWEILAAMITYKVTGGLCLDYKRLEADDYKAIIKDSPSLGTQVARWFGAGGPPGNAIDNLIKYVSDHFPYKTWDEFRQGEMNSDLLQLVPEWATYTEYRIKENDKKNPKNIETFKKTIGYKNLQALRSVAYERIINLARSSTFDVNSYVLHKQESLIRQYVGAYQYFMPGQIPPRKFKRVYVNPLTINADGSVVFENAYIFKKTKKIHQMYYGNAIVKDLDTLQIVLYSEKHNRRSGIQYMISLRIDDYGVTADHLPGIALSFTGHRNIYCYPVLLSNQKSLTIDSPFVIEYFKLCYKQFKNRAHTGRMECISPDKVLDLWQKHATDR